MLVTCIGYWLKLLVYLPCYLLEGVSVFFSDTHLLSSLAFFMVKAFTIDITTVRPVRWFVWVWDSYRQAEYYWPMSYEECH